MITADSVIGIQLSLLLFSFSFKAITKIQNIDKRLFGSCG